MPQAKQSESEANESFVLKHRVVGAATLLFFGALVLPWLLGPPSAASKTSDTQVNDAPVAVATSADIEDELLVEIANQDIIEEEVYISKITPFDSKSLNQDQPALNDGPEQAKSDTSGTNNDSAIVRKIKENELLAQKAQAAEKVKAERQAADRLAAQAKADSEKQALYEKYQQAKQTADKQSKIESDLAAALIAETAALEAKSALEKAALEKAALAQANKVERGWVVQVGLFENKQGAERVAQDLQSKGFAPSMTVVDTNRGKATGTRVWLGPFSQRVDAAKAKTRLADQTGEDGFIRVYP